MRTPPRFCGLWVSRFGWLLVLWAAGVAAVAGVAMLIRILMTLAGLTK